MNDKIHFDDFAEQVALETGYDLESAKSYIYALFETIIEANERGDIVKVRNFGSFKPVHNKARRVVNPQTGAPMNIPAHHHIHFSSSQALSSIVNAPYSHLHATKLSEVKSNTWIYGLIAGVVLIGAILGYLSFGGEEKKPAEVEETVIREVPEAETATSEPEIMPAEEPEIMPAAAPQAIGDDVDETVQEAPVTEPEKEKQSLTVPEAYDVHDRDSLYGISAILYSNPHFWPAIFSENSVRVHDPDRIYPETVLKIPEKPDITNSDELAELDSDYVRAYQRYKKIGKNQKALWLLYTGCIKFDKKLLDYKGIEPKDKETVLELLKRFDP